LNALNIVDLSNTFLCGNYNEDVCGINSKMDGSIRTIPSCKVNTNMCNNCSFCPTICNPVIFKYSFIDWGSYEEVSFEKDIYNPSRVLCKGSTHACPVSYYFCVNNYNMDNTVNKIHFNITTGNIVMNTYVNFINTESLLEPTDESIYKELESDNNKNFVTENNDTFIASTEDVSSIENEFSVQTIQEEMIALNQNVTTNTNTNTTTNDMSSNSIASNTKTNSTQPEDFQTIDSNDENRETIEYYKNYYKNYYKDYYKNESDQKIYKLCAFILLICWALGLLLFIVWILIKHSDSERYGRKCYDL